MIGLRSPERPAFGGGGNWGDVLKKEIWYFRVSFTWGLKFQDNKDPTHFFLHIEDLPFNMCSG